MLEFYFATSSQHFKIMLEYYFATSSQHFKIMLEYYYTIGHKSLSCIQRVNEKKKKH